MTDTVLVRGMQRAVPQTKELLPPMTNFIEPDPEDVLALPIPNNDAGADTVKKYLIELLAQLWYEEEGFSGKRPFGNSSWQYELTAPVKKAWPDFNPDDLIEQAIRAL